MHLSSGVITPNGDGVNDRLTLEYALFLLPAPVPVVLEVYDLAGNRRAHVEIGAYRARVRSGPFGMAATSRVRTPAAGPVLIGAWRW